MKDFLVCFHLDYTIHNTHIHSSIIAWDSIELIYSLYLWAVYDQIESIRKGIQIHSIRLALYQCHVYIKKEYMFLTAPDSCFVGSILIGRTYRVSVAYTAHVNGLSHVLRALLFAQKVCVCSHGASKASLYTVYSLALIWIFFFPIPSRLCHGAFFYSLKPICIQSSGM